jgi:hypothetical protein
MIEELIHIQYLALAFAGVMALLWVVSEASRRRPERPSEKARIFACGVDAKPEELNVPQGSHYQYMRRFLMTGPLARAHSGDLSTYISWILAGLAIIMAVMVIMW